VGLVHQFKRMQKFEVEIFERELYGRQTGKGEVGSLKVKP